MVINKIDGNVFCSKIQHASNPNSSIKNAIIGTLFVLLILLQIMVRVSSVYNLNCSSSF